MRPWLVLPIIPLLALVLGHSADAAGIRGSHHHWARQANNHHHSSSYLARMTDSDGWNPIEAGISAPVQLASFETSAPDQSDELWTASPTHPMCVRSRPASLLTMAPGIKVAAQPAGISSTIAR